MRLPNQVQAVWRDSAWVASLVYGVLPSIINNDNEVGYTTNDRLDNAQAYGDGPYQHYGPLCRAGANLCRGAGSRRQQYRCCGPGFACATDGAGRPLCNALAPPPIVVVPPFLGGPMAAAAA